MFFKLVFRFGRRFVISCSQRLSVVSISEDVYLKIDFWEILVKSYKKFLFQYKYLEKINEINKKINELEENKLFELYVVMIGDVFIKGEILLIDNKGVLQFLLNIELIVKYFRIVLVSQVCDIMNFNL